MQANLHLDSLLHLFLKVEYLLEYHIPYPIVLASYPLDFPSDIPIHGPPRHLHRNCLENDSLLLEARPLAKQLAAQLAAKPWTSSRDLATMAGALGYLGIIDVPCAEERWEGLKLQRGDNGGWRCREYV